MAKLTLINTDKAGTEYALEEGKTYILGRNEDCDIPLNSIAGISRQHAMFKYDAEKKVWTVKDLNSQNGVYFNKDRIKFRELEDNDALWLSSARLLFEDVAATGNKNIYFEEASKEDLDKATKDTGIRIRPPTSHGDDDDLVLKDHIAVEVVEEKPVAKPETGDEEPAKPKEDEDVPKLKDSEQPAAKEPEKPKDEEPPTELTLDPIDKRIAESEPEPVEKPSPEPKPEPVSAPEPVPEPEKEKPRSAPPLDDVNIDVEQIKTVRRYVDLIEKEFAKVIVGQREVLDLLLTALLADGHALMIGLPGLAKTLMVSTLSQVLDLRFKRIQFTPDLMPSDIIGSDILDIDDETSKRSFRFIQGPIFTNMLLADEINRTPPKTQAALLEAMQERQVTASNQQFKLPQPFFVLATQNPLEQEGTYPLPEAQLDRFMFNIIVDYPAEAEEEQIVMQTTRRQTNDCETVINGEELTQLQELVRDLPVSPHVVKYATRLTRSTRPGEESAPPFIKEHVTCGAGPRAAQYLILGAKARAVLHGNLNVSCDDVRALAHPILRHRIYTNFTAESEGVTPDDIIKRLLLSVTEPSPGDY